MYQFKKKLIHLNILLLLSITKHRMEVYRMEAIVKAVKNMSLAERYRLKMSLKELFEEKEIVYLDTHALGRISMLDWHYKEPYQVFLCNEHKEVELTIDGCYVCASNHKY